MSKSITPGYVDPLGIIVYGFNAVGGVLAQGTTVPVDGTSGYAPGCVFIDADAAGGLQVWFNEGNKASSAFKAVGSTASGTFANINATNATITNLMSTNQTVGGTQTMANNANFVINTTNGTQYGTAANQKQGWWGAVPVVQPNAIGELLGLNGNAATAANATNMNSNGNLGTRAYSYNDLVKDLKTSGLIATN